MDLFSFNHSALVLIDIQKGLDDWNYYGGSRNNLFAESNAGKILHQFRNKGFHVIHVKHNSNNPESPLYPEKPGNQIKAKVKPLEKELIIEKNTSSAFLGTGLNQYLKSIKVDHLIIVGLTLEHCISSSIRMASDLAYKVHLVKDATAAFAKEIAGKTISAEAVFETTLTNLEKEFCQFLSTNELISRLEVNFS